MIFFVELDSAKDICSGGCLYSIANGTFFSYFAPQSIAFATETGKKEVFLQRRLFRIYYFSFFSVVYTARSKDS